MEPRATCSTRLAMREIGQLLEGKAERACECVCCWPGTGFSVRWHTCVSVWASQPSMPSFWHLGSNIAPFRCPLTPWGQEAHLRPREARHQQTPVWVKSPFREPSCSRALEEGERKVCTHWRRGFLTPDWGFSQRTPGFSWPVVSPPPPEPSRFWPVLWQIPQPCCALHALASCLQAPEIILSTPLEGRQLQLKGLQRPTEWLLPRTPAKWQRGPVPWPEKGEVLFPLRPTFSGRGWGKPQAGERNEFSQLWKHHQPGLRDKV